jgi:phosphoribosylpyrophosphate synthetase
MILVDDFVTRGATMIGAASRLLDQFPSVDLKAFALVRSLTSADIDAIRQPCIGTLELRQN